MIQMRYNWVDEETFTPTREEEILLQSLRKQNIAPKDVCDVWIDFIPAVDEEFWVEVKDTIAQARQFTLQQEYMKFGINVAMHDSIYEQFVVHLATEGFLGVQKITCTDIITGVRVKPPKDWPYRDIMINLTKAAAKLETTVPYRFYYKGVR